MPPPTTASAAATAAAADSPAIAASPAASSGDSSAAVDDGLSERTYLKDLEGAVRAAKEKGVVVGVFPGLMYPKKATVKFFEDWAVATQEDCSSCKELGKTCEPTNLNTYKCWSCYVDQDVCSRSKYMQKKRHGARPNCRSYDMAVQEHIQALPEAANWHHRDHHLGAKAQQKLNSGEGVSHSGRDVDLAGQVDASDGGEEVGEQPVALIVEGVRCVLEDEVVPDIVERVCNTIFIKFMPTIVEMDKNIAEIVNWKRKQTGGEDSTITTTGKRKHEVLDDHSGDKAPPLSQKRFRERAPPSQPVAGPSGTVRTPSPLV